MAYLMMNGTSANDFVINGSKPTCIVFNNEVIWPVAPQGYSAYRLDLNANSYDSFTIDGVSADGVQLTTANLSGTADGNTISDDVMSKICVEDNDPGGVYCQSMSLTTNVTPISTIRWHHGTWWAPTRTYTASLYGLGETEDLIASAECEQGANLYYELGDN